MQWFEGFVFGRTAHRCVRVLGELSLRASRSSDLTQYELRCLRTLKDRVISAPPVQTSSSIFTTWYVFTDGACEGAESTESKQGSIGGVLGDLYGNFYKYFSSEVPASIMSKLFSEVSGRIPWIMPKQFSIWTMRRLALD